MESVHAEGLEGTKALSRSSWRLMTERETCGKSGKIMILNYSKCNEKPVESFKLDVV